MSTEEETQTVQRQSRNVLEYNYRDVDSLSRYVTDTGKILPRRITGLNAKQQRHVARLIKRARNMLLMK